MNKYWVEYKIKTGGFWVKEDEFVTTDDLEDWWDKKCIYSELPGLKLLQVVRL